MVKACLPVVVLSLALAPLACSRPAPSQDPNLLAGLRPHRFSRVTHVDRLADGVAAREGDHWLTNRSSHLRSDWSYVEWDLGAARPVACVLLQGDNNDAYRLTGSIDGESDTWSWAAEPVPEAGMRTRQAKVAAQVRYLRLEAEGGDRSHSVSEVAIFSECPSGWPGGVLRIQPGTPAEKASLGWLAAAGFFGLLFLIVHRQGAGRWHFLLAAIALALGVVAVRFCAELHPFANTLQESVVRAIVAALAGVLVLKESLVGPRHAPDARVAKVSLGLLAALALGCYYHFGSLQFFDESKGRQTLAHGWDMRNYFPTVKYFPELRFEGVYLASLAAYLEIEGDGALDRVRHATLRDLATNKIITVEQALPKMEAVRSRFSPERWTQFKRDMAYFVESMGGPSYLGSMYDHGGNATPVWLLAAWVLLRDLPANETTLSLVSLIDPALLLLLFAVVGRTFGTRVMLYTVVLFGATDFYQFGSNLVGSTLRQDWLVALGLGVCAIRKERPFLGGMLLAYGGLIRAFPAMAALFLMVPLGWWLVDALRSQRRWPSLRDLRQSQRATLRAVFGAAASVLLFVTLSTAVFGWKPAWVGWWTKIEMHAVGPSVNNVGLRNLLGFRPQHAAHVLARSGTADVWASWDAHQFRNFAQLRPAFYVICALALGLVFLACRGRPLHQVPLLGLFLVPYFFYPSNYYFHFVFLLPLSLAPDPGKNDRTWAIFVLMLAALCVGQLATYAARGTDLRYTFQSGLLLAVFSVMLFMLAAPALRDLRSRPGASPQP